MAPTKRHERADEILAELHGLIKELERDQENIEKIDHGSATRMLAEAARRVENSKHQMYYEGEYLTRLDGDESWEETQERISGDVNESLGFPRDSGLPT